jgi:hypothetical protein
VRTLASQPTRVFTKDELLRSIWGFRTLGSNRRKVSDGTLAVTSQGQVRPEGPVPPA